jgi:hypothetical protein
MSRRAATRGFGVIPGFFVIAALLAGILLVGTANPAPAATAGPCAAHLTTVSRSVASASPSPGASSGPATTPASSTPATPTPSPTTTPATSPPPTPTTSPSATPTTSPSPSPRSSSTSPAPKAHLCLTVQSLTASVRAGGQARYAIWAWLAGGSRGTAKIKIAAKPGGLAPSFTVCARPGGNMCSVGLTSKAVQLRAAVAAPRKAAGTRITLRATGTSPQAAASASSSDSVLVKAKPAPSTTPAGTTSPAGVGVLLPIGNLPPGVLSRSGLPVLPSPVDDATLAFPLVSPSPSASPSPTQVPIRVADVSASFPLETRLVGGQIIGLAVLAAAVTIAVARLSLRRQQPQQSRDPD